MFAERLECPPEDAGSCGRVCTFVSASLSLAVYLPLCGEGNSVVLPTFLSVFHLCSPSLTSGKYTTLSVIGSVTGRGLLQISVGGLAPLSSVPLLQPTVLQWLERMKPRALLYFQLHLADELVLDCLTLGCLTRPFCTSLQKKGDVGHAWPCSVLPGDSGQCSKVSLGPPAALICLREGKDAE